MLLEIRNGTVSRGSVPVLQNFSFEIRGEEKAAIVGKNGAGKTTLLEVISGERELDASDRHPEPVLTRARAFTVGMLRQKAAEDPEQTVEEVILEDAARGGLYEKERYDYEQRYDRMFTGFGFRLEDREKKIGEFSGGEQTKIALIRLLLAQPDVLLLDEPTNHLDLASVEWLEQCVREYPHAVIFVSHDRYFIDQTADVVWEAAGGRMVRYPGGYTAYREQKAALYDRRLRAYKRQQEEIQKEKELIEKFRTKPRKAAFARSRRNRLGRMEVLEKPEADDAVIRTAPLVPARLGNKCVLDCERLRIGYDVPIREVSFRLRRGQKVGVMGPNGTGKSTFLKTVAGLIPALGGRCTLGENIDAAYFDQMSASITSDQNVLSWFVSRYPSMKEGEIRDVLAGYLFYGKDLGKRVSDLSGGERARLVLASLLQSAPNFLLLDEPTNAMDIPARETIESVLRSYTGSLLVVSHDRYFLDRVTEQLLIFEPGSSKTLYYPFGYQHYAERKKQQKEYGSAAALRTAEEQRLIEGLRAVPEPEHHRLREIPTEEAAADWKFGLNRRDREAAEQEFQEALAQRDSEAYWTEESQQTAVEMRIEQARSAWTALCTDWYDLWLDKHPEFPLQ